MILAWIEAWKDWVTVLSASWYNLAKDVVVRVITTFALFLTLLWISIFLYGSFYYSYMPSVQHVQDVNFHFSNDCPDGSSVCSYPSANMSMIKENKAELLMRGQKYRIMLELEMPESPKNQQLGMFMVAVKFYTRFGEVVKTGSRAAMLHFKSSLLQAMETIAYAPFFLMGTREQKQVVTVDLMDKFLDDPYKPALGVYIEIQTKAIEIYSATLKINTHFTGLRYLIYTYPTMAAIFGIGTNMVFLCLVTLLSWYQFITNRGTKVMVKLEKGGPLLEKKGTLDERRSKIKGLFEKQREGLKVISSRPVRTQSASSLTDAGGHGPISSTSTDPGPSSKAELEAISPSKSSLDSREDATDDNSVLVHDDAPVEVVMPSAPRAEVEDIGLRHRTTTS